MYFAIELTNVLVGDIMPEIHEGQLLREHLALKYSKVKWQYTQQKIGGGSKGMTVGGWDSATNQIC